MKKSSQKTGTYKLIAIAGTFDRLHKGHKYFISQAFKYGSKVIIGLTSDFFVKEKLKAQNSKLKTSVNNYEVRKKELEEFLTHEKLLDRTQIVKIDDIYGPAIENNQIEALAVTDDTSKGGEKVNRKRRELGLKSLKILKVPIILSDDKKKIASTRIRLGEMDRLGRLFVSRIREELRQELKKPIGELLTGDPNNLFQIADRLKKHITNIDPVMIVTVGDEVTRVCNEVGIAINLAIVDFKVGRVEKYHSLSELGFLNSKAPKTPRMVTGKPANAQYTPGVAGWSLSGSHDSPGVKVTNPPGHITKQLVDAVADAYKGIIKDSKQRIIQVDGEEDLAGVPAILLAPLGTIVLYGQPGEGVVLVQITEKIKNKLATLLQKN